MGTMAALGAALLAFLQKVLPTLRQGLLIAAGMVAQNLKDKADRSEKLAETYKQILEVEQRNAARSGVGAAGRLRNSGYARKK